jgi:hypothetical protein
MKPVARPACALLRLHEGIGGTEGHAIPGALSMIPKNVQWFSEKIMLNQEAT